MKPPRHGRRTKIICTLGPSTDLPTVLERVIRAGMDIARFNTSHGTLAQHAARLRRLRACAARLKRPIEVLVDLPGAKFRLGTLRAGAVELRAGERAVLQAGSRGGRAGIPVNDPKILKELKRGESIYLADGLVLLEVERVIGGRAHCRVVRGGTIRSRSGLNLPDSQLTVEVPTEEDRERIAFACRQGVEWIGVSFVRTAGELQKIRSLLYCVPKPPRLMAKIEKPQALQHLRAILEEADGVMVARGDLGIETPLAEVPFVQKRVIAQANQMHKPAVTATHMLESMVDQPMPTRAEVSDIVNAILDGSDALMLSAETAIGRYPVESVERLASVILSTEAHMAREPSRRHPRR